MKKVTLADGTECTRFLERADQDGGLVLVHMVPDGNGGWFAHRHWIGHGIRAGRPPNSAERRAGQDAARQAFEQMDIAEIGRRAAMARGTSGRIT